MLGEKPRHIRQDEDDFLTWYSVDKSNRTELKHGNSIVARLLRIDEVVKHQSGRSIRAEDKIDLVREKDKLLYKLLEQRADHDRSSIKATLMQYPGEVIHPYSTNMITVTANDQDGDPHSFITYLDYLARANGLQDSQDVLDLIGDFDSSEPSNHNQLLSRTFNESRNVRRMLVNPRNYNDDSSLATAREVYDEILPERIREICDDEDFSLSFDPEYAEFIFSNDDGEPVYSQYLYDDVAHIIELSGIPITNADQTED